MGCKVVSSIAMNTHRNCQARYTHARGSFYTGIPSRFFIQEWLFFSRLLAGTIGALSRAGGGSNIDSYVLDSKS